MCIVKVAKYTCGCESSKGKTKCKSAPSWGRCPYDEKQVSEWKTGPCLKCQQKAREKASKEREKQKKKDSSSRHKKAVDEALKKYVK